MVCWVCGECVRVGSRSDPCVDGERASAAYPPSPALRPTSTHALTRLTPLHPSAVLLSAMFLGDKPTLPVLAVLVPIIGGVVLASTSELSFTWKGFLSGEERAGRVAPAAVGVGHIHAAAALARASSGGACSSQPPAARPRSRAHPRRAPPPPAAACAQPWAAT